MSGTTEEKSVTSQERQVDELLLRLRGLVRPRGSRRWWEVAVGRMVKPFIHLERLVNRVAAIDVVVVEQAHERDERLDQLVRETPLGCFHVCLFSVTDPPF
jgi:hypothetical protein